MPLLLTHVLAAKLLRQPFFLQNHVSSGGNNSNYSVDDANRTYQDPFGIAHPFGEKPTPPELLLEFTATMNVGGALMKVTVDNSSRKIATFNMNANGDDGGAQDGAILDFDKGLQYQHERFFDEVVCYKMQFADDSVREAIGKRRPKTASANRSPPAPDVEAAQTQFLGSLSQIFGVPLDMYQKASNTSDVDAHEIVGRPCQSWDSRESWQFAMTEQGIVPLTSIQKPAFALPNWMLDDMVEDANLTSMLSEQRPTIQISTEVNASFCVTTEGELLRTASGMRMSMVLINETSGETSSLTLGENHQETVAVSPPIRFADPRRFRPTLGVAGQTCVDLTPGTQGARELGSHLNDATRLHRINSEAGGEWEAAAYEIWDGLTVNEVVHALGTEISPLKLRMTLDAKAVHLNVMHGTAPQVPTSFDCRAKWPRCTSIGHVKNQGGCGSCWAFSAVSVLADRFCIHTNAEANLLEANASFSSPGAEGAAAMLQLSAVEALSLSPEHLVDCDTTNAGCGGGRLDDVWNFLRDHGVPPETCTPYQYCRMPNEPKCGANRGYSDGNQMASSAPSFDKGCGLSCADGTSKGDKLFRASMAYAAAPPADVFGIQKELMNHGPVQVSFFVFSDFHSYRKGVYSRTPAAYGPVGGHAVRLVGWGVANEQTEKSVDYWLLANSWSPLWGIGGFFKIKRGVNECGIESTPAAGMPRLL